MIIYEVKFSNTLPIYLSTLYSVRKRIALEELQVLEYIERIVLDEDDVLEFVVNFLMINKLSIEKIERSRQRVFL